MKDTNVIYSVTKEGSGFLSCRYYTVRRNNLPLFDFVNEDDAHRLVQLLDRLEKEAKDKVKITEVLIRMTKWVGNNKTMSLEDKTRFVEFLEEM